MVQIGNLKFSTSLGVLYDLKQKYGHTRLNETYKKLAEEQEIDSVIEILNISYNKANKVNLNEEEFAQLMEENDIGFLKLSEMFGKVVEGIMFNGMTPEEIEERKNLLTNLKK